MNEKPLNRISELQKMLRIKEAGYAGVMPNGNLVDRREHPEAQPIMENAALNIPKPKPIP